MIMFSFQTVRCPECGSEVKYKEINTEGSLEDATSCINCEDSCPHGGDIANDCEDCAYKYDYHYADGECVRRTQDE